MEMSSILFSSLGIAELLVIVPIYALMVWFCVEIIRWLRRH